VNLKYQEKWIIAFTNNPTNLLWTCLLLNHKRKTDQKLRGATAFHVCGHLLPPILMPDVFVTVKKMFWQNGKMVTKTPELAFSLAKYSFLAETSFT
jgi:hypothetical protein